MESNKTFSDDFSPSKATLRWESTPAKQSNEPDPELNPGPSTPKSAKRSLDDFENPPKRPKTTPADGPTLQEISAASYHTEPTKQFLLRAKVEAIMAKFTESKENYAARVRDLKANLERAVEVMMERLDATLEAQQAEQGSELGQIFEEVNERLQSVEMLEEVLMEFTRSIESFVKRIPAVTNSQPDEAGDNV